MVAVCSRKGKFCVNISVIFLFNLFLLVAYIVQRAILSVSCSHALDDVSRYGKFWNVLCPGSRASPRLRPRPQATLNRRTWGLASDGRSPSALRKFVFSLFKSSCGSMSFIFISFACNSYHNFVRMLFLTLNLICTGQII
jgi:hypothetical protein